MKKYWKHILIGSIAIIVILLIVWFFTKEKIPAEKITAQNMSVSALDPAVTSDGQIVYYDLKEGDLLLTVNFRRKLHNAPCDVAF